MAGKNTAAFGIYRTTPEVDNAVNSLQAAGFRTEDISVLFPENEGTQRLRCQEKHESTGGCDNRRGNRGGAGGWTGTARRDRRIGNPRRRAFHCRWSHHGDTRRSGSGRCCGGNRRGAVGMGIPEFEAKRYEGEVKKGGILLSVHCDNSEWTSRAKKVLEQTGAHDISSTGEAGADFNKSDRPVPKAS